MTKKARQTNSIERFNTTLMQRIARLVREIPSFSKKLALHLGAINYELCYSHPVRGTALPMYVALPG